ncbi:MAG: hypothetical protein DRH20_14040, partial [Deltaproteobacteria bacterium]
AQDLVYGHVHAGSLKKPFLEVRPGRLFRIEGSVLEYAKQVRASLEVMLHEFPDALAEDRVMRTIMPFPFSSPARITSGCESAIYKLSCFSVD